MDTRYNKCTPLALPLPLAAPAAARFPHLENCCTLPPPHVFKAVWRYPVSRTDR